MTHRNLHIRLRLPAAVTCVGFVLAAASAIAAAPDDEASKPLPSAAAGATWSHLQLAVTAGVGAVPTGYLGIEGAWVPLRFLELSAGTGVGENGPVVALMPRLRAWLRPVALTLGAGVWAGQLEWRQPGHGGERPVREGLVAWGAGDLGAIYGLADGGFAFRVNAGISMMLNPENLKCPGQPSDTYDRCNELDQRPRTEDKFIPYVGGAVLYGF